MLVSTPALPILSRENSSLAQCLSPADLEQAHLATVRGEGVHRRGEKPVLPGVTLAGPFTWSPERADGAVFPEALPAVEVARESVP